MPQPIDQNERRNYIDANFQKIKHLSKEERIDCPRCGAKDSFTLNTKDTGFPYNCWSCSVNGNIFTTENLGFPKFTDKGYSTGRKTGLPEIEFLRNNYVKTSKASHRLSQQVLNHFKIKPFEYLKKDGSKKFKSLSIFGSDDRPIKRLVASKWIGVDKKIRSVQKWYGQDKLSADKKIFVCAGEWDWFALWDNTGPQDRIYSIAWPNGESPRRWEADDLTVFGQNKQIIILYDNDNVGRAGAVSLGSAILRKCKCDWVKIVDLAGLGLLGGQDLDDFFLKGGTKERLLQEIADTKPFNVSLALHEESNPNPLPTPVGIYFYNSDTIKKLWDNSQHTQARRDNEIAKMAFQLTGQTQGKEFKESLLRLSQEVQSLRYSACMTLVKAAFELSHIVRRKSHLGDQGFNLLYYDKGVFVLSSENFFEVIADQILRKVFPADKIRSRQTDREAILEEMRILTNYQEERVFDQNKKYINFENGLYCIKKKKLIKHSSKHSSTFQVKINFEETKCPEFVKALDRWFDEQNKREFIKSVYYFLTGNRSEEVAILLRGPGNDGKSKSLEIFKALAGPGSTSAITLAELTGHTLASLDGSFLNVVEDASDSKFDSGAFKKIVSGGLTQINQKNKPVYSIEPKALFVISSNYPIRNSDTSRGFLRRWKLIEFKEIKERDQVKDFFNKRLKAELSGIAWYCITKGGKAWDEDKGFRITLQEQAEKTDMRSNSSPDAYFIMMLETYREKGLDMESRHGVDDFFKSDNTSDYIDILGTTHYKHYVDFCDENGIGSAGHKKYNQAALRFFNETINGMLEEGFAIITNVRRRIVEPGVLDIVKIRKRVLDVKLPKGLKLSDLIGIEMDLPF